MPQLIQDAQGGGFGNMMAAMTSPFGSMKTDPLNVVMTGILKIYAGVSKLFPMAQIPLAERAMYGTMGVMDTLARASKKDLIKPGILRNVFPGYMAVYVAGKLDNIIPFQFEAKILSDDREATFEAMDFGVNELSTYHKTALRKIELETTYATTDPGYYNAHYVEGKIREIQGLVYAGAGETNFFDKDSPQRDLTAPPLIGLFIGDKFLRRRLPRVVYDKAGSESKLTVDDLLDKGVWKALASIPVARTAAELALMFAFVEPIYWKVESVSVNWDESPYDVGFSQGNVGSIPIPGQSKLPMFQKVSMSLLEHRAPSTFERRRDVDSFTTPQNAIARALG